MAGVAVTRRAGSGRARSCVGLGGARVARIRPGRWRWAGDWELGRRVRCGVPVFGRWRAPLTPLPPPGVGPVQPSPEANLDHDTQGRIGKSSSVLVRGLWISGPRCLCSVDDTPHHEFCGSFLRP